MRREQWEQTPDKVHLSAQKNEHALNTLNNSYIMLVDTSLTRAPEHSHPHDHARLPTNRYIHSETSPLEIFEVCPFRCSLLCFVSLSSDRHYRILLRTSIHILNDDSLLNIFHHCRPIPLYNDEPDDDSVLQRTARDRERWWYKVAQVCRKWRFLTFASASHLGICLVCTYGTPVAEMLAHSPSFPLVIDYVDQDREITREDEEGILLALHRRRRIHRIRLCIPVPKLSKVILAIDGQFPMLEYLYIKSLAGDECVSLPGTFQAPYLRSLVLTNVAHSSSISRHDPPLTPRVQPSERLGLYARCSGPQLIHILDDDSLLNIFHHFQPVPNDEDEADDSSALWTDPNRKRWWYRLAHVCRRWRFLVFASASHLGICLVCTYGTPIEEMLAHSPPLPLAIDYVEGDHKFTPEDEEGIFLVFLYCRLRVRHIRLCIPDSNLQIVISAMVGEFPMLEDLYIKHSANDEGGLMLPETFQAPHLRHIVPGHLAYSHGSSRHGFMALGGRSYDHKRSWCVFLSPMVYCLEGEWNPSLTGSGSHFCPSSTVIHFSTYLTFVGLVSLTKTRLTRCTYYKAEFGPVNAGGTSSLRFAKGGDTLYLAQLPALVFAFFVHVERQ